MTPQFTTPCYIRVDDPKKRKEVIDSLYQIGYFLGQHSADALDDFITTYPNISGTFCTGSEGYYDEIDLKGCIDCGHNMELFLALAGMRSDTYVNQWHIAQTHIMFNKLKGEVITVSKKRYIKIGEMFMPLKQNLRFTWFGGNSSELFRKATAQEIIEHFNKQEK